MTQALSTESLSNPMRVQAQYNLMEQLAYLSVWEKDNGKIKSMHVIPTETPLTTLRTTFNSYLHFDNVALIFKYKNKTMGLYNGFQKYALYSKAMLYF